MGHLTYGYKMNERGRIVHRLFDIDDLRHGDGKREGWYDSPDKVPGAKKAQIAEDARKAETAHTTAPEPSAKGPIHGEKRRPGRPRKNS
ncbi:MAG: hypothetical protein KIT32_12320 [Rhodocyclaceae bacterium]|nr:hypothetical protein [Rhodocyclaceae bacterium]